MIEFLESEEQIVSEGDITEPLSVDMRSHLCPPLKYYCTILTAAVPQR
jgi:hypothetical protein